MARVSCPAPPAYCEAPRSASSDSRSLLGPAICRSGWSALIMTSALPGKLLLATFPWNPHDLRKRVPHFHRADVADFPARDASQYQHHLPKAALSLPPATRRQTPRISLGAACSLCVPSARHGPPGKDAARWSRPGPKRSLFESGNLYCGERLKRCDAKEAPVTGTRAEVLESDPDARLDVVEDGHARPMAARLAYDDRGPIFFSANNAPKSMPGPTDLSTFMPTA
jgi:hypothetical protein